MVPPMVRVDWGNGPRQERVNDDELDALLDRIDAEARRVDRPEDVQVTVNDAGSLGIVLGADWRVLNHVPPDLNPPYRVTVGNDPSYEPVAFYVARDHYSETLRRNTIGADVARAAMRHFIATGKLSPDLGWEEI
jgi:hypothetical protein